jgi:hypothetical protein
MIYMVECEFGDPVREAAWNAWYSAHLAALLSVPGIRTAQRFRSIGAGIPTYRALYTLDSPGVFTSQAYLDRKGGRFPEEWLASITHWHRNVFDGIGVVPDVTPDQCLVVAQPDAAAPADIGVKWLPSAALERSVAKLGLAVTTRPRGEQIARLDQPGVAVYEPITPQLHAR